MFRLPVLIYFQYDFSGMGPFLFGGLIALLATGLVGVFIPFSKTIDLIYGFGGALLFSGYIVYDVSDPRSAILKPHGRP